MLFDTNTTNPMYAEKDFATERRVAKVLCPWLVALVGRFHAITRLSREQDWAAKV